MTTTMASTGVSHRKLLLLLSFLNLLAPEVPPTTTPQVIADAQTTVFSPLDWKASQVRIFSRPIFTAFRISDALKKTIFSLQSLAVVA